MATEAKDETPKSESAIDKLIEKADALIELRTQEHLSRTSGPGPTDPSTRPDFKTAPDTAELVDSEMPKKGLLPMPLAYADRKSFNQTKFPRGDYENFSLARYCLALQKVTAGFESSSAMHEIAPWETQYYEAAKNVKFTDPVTKAQGDMVSGQDGGFLAPEFWSSTFFDQLYASQVVTQLPITTMRMGYRVS